MRTFMERLIEIVERVFREAGFNPGKTKSAVSVEQSNREKENRLLQNKSDGAGGCDGSEP